MPSKKRLSKAAKTSILRRNVLAWFRRAGRDLPWRKTSDAYVIVVSEIMLQQTQVDRVIPKWEAFIKKFPTWQVLAGASQADVVKMWHGLGYNRRALGLHKLAKAVVELGGMPEDPEAMRELPGIGPYTSEAVAAFAFKRPKAAPVDTNIERILKRVFNAYDFDKKQLAQLARELVPGDSWSWNHALMDLGATICTSRAPKCDICPLKDICGAYPCEGEEITKVKQSKFKDSDRFYRGRLVSFLREHNVLRRNKVGQKISLPDAKRVKKIIATLLKDQLIIEEAGVLKLLE